MAESRKNKFIIHGGITCYGRYYCPYYRHVLSNTFNEYLLAVKGMESTVLHTIYII